jgi:hypothetical protein
LAQAAQLVWLTSKERATQLQSARPRVSALLTNINPFGSPQHYVIDSQGNRRINGREATMILTLVTDSDYDNHIDWRAAVQNFMATIDTVLGDFQNLALLPYHSIARCWDKNNVAEITPQKGYFESKLEYGIIFGIYPGAWPGGLLTA